jgi:quercetin dioxygenase-like cupin family protein
MMSRREVNGTLAAALAAFLLGGNEAMFAAQKDSPSQSGERRGGPTVKTLMEEPLARMTDPVASVKVLTVEPGAVSHPHEHIGPVFAYILEGEVENQVDPHPAKTYRAGEYFYEPPMHVHRLLRNLSKSKPAKLLIFQVGEEGKQFTIDVK